MAERTPADHPARRDDFINELRVTPEGEGVAEGLDFMFSHAPHFKLPRRPTNAWDYVRLLFALFADNTTLCERVFLSRSDAYLHAAEVAEALVLHDNVYEPFRRSLIDPDHG